jgi:hypothetical protein
LKTHLRYDHDTQQWLWPFRSYYPTVRKPVWRPQGHDMRPEIAALQALDANCNTCTHLQRVPFERPSKTVNMTGHCRRYDRATSFHPDDCMGMACWQPRKPA